MTLIATENIKHILISILIKIKTHIKCCKFLLANISCIYFNNKKIAWHAKDQKIYSLMGQTCIRTTSDMAEILLSGGI